MRLLFGRAAVQVAATHAAVDILHIKGNATDPSLRSRDATGTDVDILVRPVQVDALDEAVRAYGWELYSTFEDGSPFAHAQTYLHPEWGFLDLHRRFPGIGLADDTAFIRLWEKRRTVSFCGVPCEVPDVAAQAVILLLNAARAGRANDLDTRRAWHEAAACTRMEVVAEVDNLDARLGFDAALGQVDLHRGEREYFLWRAVSRGGGRYEEWWGRFVAAPTLRAKGRIVVRAVMVNVEHLGLRLGHVPTRGEILKEFLARPARGLRELTPWSRRRR
ncbi:2-nitropropane dioxygenase [Microbacterium sp. ARD31]|uniref:2-nitropropane dioxygenase n=1 Tax=Microbacterium sp. ARD31 TaxID=2962576 RepID=UPI002882C216|nr:2-nitropropane dioxygenase [Microbacterium sp. ARD31]MDT0186467.1 2-nitropropane dioxygenase [Microbacterium sp. ARD31]